eukprot:TRINITY_DN80214_c0_g1_i1.p4 TRINITY_DN80214_c0_g1~~TRINITY_DN80214_c0_g1_i1.p4  ORF type:complete len:102 (+),score=1.13 TRINITY_DN80214_c0_g1_i1:740-1045(+)
MSKQVTTATDSRSQSEEGGNGQEQSISRGQFVSVDRQFCELRRDKRRGSCFAVGTRSRRVVITEKEAVAGTNMILSVRQGPLVQLESRCECGTGCRVLDGE